MTKDEVIKRMCVIMTLIGEAEDYTHVTGCFCGWGRSNLDFHFDDVPLEILEKAVIKELHKRHPQITKAELRRRLATRKAAL